MKKLIRAGCVPRTIFLVAVIVIMSLAPIAAAQEAIVVNSAVDGGKALVRYILSKFGDEASIALKQFGGRPAVKQVIKTAEKEGGDNLVKKVTIYGEEYGISALRALKEKPAAVAAALDRLPKAQVGKAIGAINRNSKVMPELIQRYGAGALKTELEHPGVGFRFAKELGADGIKISEKLDTKQAIVIARHLKEIEVLPKTPKAKFIATLKQTPIKTAEFLEKHPKITITAASVPVVIYAVHKLTTPIIGKDAQGNSVILKPSPLSRFATWTSNIAAKPISLTLYLLGIVLVLYAGGYFGIKLRRYLKKTNDL